MAPPAAVFSRVKLPPWAEAVTRRAARTWWSFMARVKGRRRTRRQARFFRPRHAMKHLFLPCLLLSLPAFEAAAQLRPDGATASFRGSLPPKPVAALSAGQEAELEKELAALTAGFEPVKKHPRAADAHIFLKAVRYALDFDEWYDKTPEDGLKKARKLLAEAGGRIAALKKNRAPWMDGPGWKVLGFYSRIDDSPQPYAVEVPEGLDTGKKKAPMWLWLHGRGDTATDLHFIAGKLGSTKPGQFQPQGTIVVHPFGRYCNGWKSAGETDVFEARDDAAERFGTDPDRVALAGFSMGGAGAWHIGAHYPDQWACVHAGAGFVDVRRYQKLTPEKYPAWHEQKLWGMYDVPDAARNLLNVPLVVYSGEEDTQRDAAAYMEEVLAKEGLVMRHHIGPGMGHKYHPEVIKTVQAEIEAAVSKGRDRFPNEVRIQARTPFYGRVKWLNLHGMERSWEDARIDARVAGGRAIEIQTRNVNRIVMYPPPQARAGGDKLDVIIDGEKLTVALGPVLPEFETFMRPGPRSPAMTAAFVRLVKKDGQWTDFGGAQSFQHTGPEGGKTTAHPGPMDSAFMKRFLVVLPDGRSSHAGVDAWVQAESARFIQRWRSLMRGDPRVIRADDLADPVEACKTQGLILWGTPESNSVIRKTAARLPLNWGAEKIEMAGQSHDAATHVPLMIYPALESPGFEVVINSGLTFREAHDRTNSLQNPKLPDWTILDITQPPDAEKAGRVVAADFFDDFWRVK
ncbi:MAG TPA: hypothetical protein DIT64_19540 [Verrucomicrobiales bacterium]|nr:hypothetical protein [Verrucomicrobiales bacterium]